MTIRWEAVILRLGRITLDDRWLDRDGRWTWRVPGLLCLVGGEGIGEVTEVERVGDDIVARGRLYDDVGDLTVEMLRDGALVPGADLDAAEMEFRHGDTVTAFTAGRVIAVHAVGVGAWHDMRFTLLEDG